MVAITTVLLVVACLSLGEGARKKSARNSPSPQLSEESSDDSPEPQSVFKKGSPHSKEGKGEGVFGSGSRSASKEDITTPLTTQSTPMKTHDSEKKDESSKSKKTTPTSSEVVKSTPKSTPPNDSEKKAKSGKVNKTTPRPSEETKATPKPTNHKDLTTSQSNAGCPSVNTVGIMKGIDKLGVQIDDLKKDVKGIADIKNEVVNIGAKMDTYKNNTNGIIEKNYNKIDRLIVKDITKVENKLEKIYQTVVQSGGKNEGGSCSPDEIKALTSSVNQLMSAVKRIEENQNISINNIAVLVRMVRSNGAALDGVLKALNSNGGAVQKSVKGENQESCREIIDANNKIKNNIHEMIEKVNTGLQQVTELLQSSNPSEVQRDALKTREILGLTRSVKDDVLRAASLLSSQFAEIQKLFQVQTGNMDAFWRSIMNAIHQQQSSALAETKNELKKYASRSLCPSAKIRH